MRSGDKVRLVDHLLLWDRAFVGGERLGMVIAVEPNMNRAVRVLWENGMSGWYRYNELVHLPSMLRRQGWWL